MTPQSGLCKLSFDTILNVFHFLQPEDIIAIRKTCKYLSQMTYERIVWLDALERCCRYNGMFLPSFPLVNMSTKHLEHSALAPHRFSSIVHDRSKSVLEPLQPVSTRILEEVTEVVRNIFFVPGGRFLITCSDEAIRVWDISAETRLLASKLGSSLDLFDCVPTPDGTGLLLFFGVRSTQVVGSYTEIGVQKVCLTTPNPNFQQVGIFRKENKLIELGNWHFSANMVILAASYCDTFFWRYDVDKIAEMCYVRKVLQIDDDIILDSDDHRFSLYNMPRFYAHKNGVFTDFENQSDAVTKAQPIMKFHHPSDLDPGVQLPRFWLPTHSDRSYFCVVAFSYTDPEYLIHDSYTISEKNHLDKTHKISIIRHSYVPDYAKCSPRYHLGNYSPAVRFCAGHLVLSWYGKTWRGDIIISTEKIDELPLAQGGNDTLRGRTRYLWTPSPSVAISGFSLCPASGRLCILSDQGKIHILDFLPVL